jgi:hypothetical protein
VEHNRGRPLMHRRNLKTMLVLAAVLAIFGFSYAINLTRF